MKNKYLSLLFVGLALLFLSFTIGCGQSQSEEDTTSTPPLAPACFVLSNLTITPTSVIAGEVVAISVEVSNTGGTEGSYTVVFKVRLEWTGWENVEVTLKPGQTKTVTYTTKGVSRIDASGSSMVVPGTYMVDVNGKVGQFTVTEPPPTPEELEAKQVITDLAYIGIFVAGYSDDADPESDGLSLRITFYDSKSEPITFQAIPATVTIKLYGYGYIQGLRGDTPYLVYKDEVTIDSSGVFGEEIKIPFENTMVDQRYYPYGTVEVTVTTPKQGSFQAMSNNFVELYPRD